MVENNIKLQVLLKVYTPENYDEHVPFAILDLDAKMVQSLIDKIKLMQEQTAKDPALYVMSYGNYWLDVYYGRHYEEALGEVKFQELCERTEDVHAFLPAPIFGDHCDPSKAIPGDMYFRMDCSTLDVSDTDVHWEFYEKHTDCRITTACLSLAALEHLLEDAEGKTVPPACECTKALNESYRVCRWCWANGRHNTWDKKPGEGQQKLEEVMEGV